MSYIASETNFPGILSLMKAYPDTAKPLNALADLLLRRESETFSKAERETVASYVSYLNECQFCSESHAAVADYHWQKPDFHHAVWANPETAPISERLKALLRIASKVQKSGKSVEQKDVDAALSLGATEPDVHDTVLIAAAFCMFNRYVDGLGTAAAPRGHESYGHIGKMLGECGYSQTV